MLVAISHLDRMRQHGVLGFLHAAVLCGVYLTNSDYVYYYSLTQAPKDIISTGIQFDG